MFSFSCTKERKEEVPFSMAIGNRELMYECFPKHWPMGTARMKENDTDEDGKKRGVSMEKVKRARKMKSQRPKALNYSSGLSSPGSLRFETVDEFPN